MPSLDLKMISSVKSTKITSAMKMVADKTKRAQDNAEKSRPYAEKMKQVVSSCKIESIKVILSLVKRLLAIQIKLFYCLFALQ